MARVWAFLYGRTGTLVVRMMMGQDPVSGKEVTLELWPRCPPEAERLSVISDLLLVHVVRPRYRDLPITRRDTERASVNRASVSACVPARVSKGYVAIPGC